MKQVTDYYFDLQNIRDIDDCSDNCNDNVFIIFKQCLEPILKDNDDYDITVLDNDIELFKMTGGDGSSTFPYKQFEEILDFLFQRSKFMQEKKDNLYNSLFTVEKKNDSNVPSENIMTPPGVDTPVPPPVVDAPVPPPDVGDTPVPPPVVDTPVPPPPPVVDTPVPPPPVVDTPVPPPPPVVDTSVATPVPPPPVVDNNSNVITQPPSNQNGGYKRMQQNVFKNITNVITVKLSVYNNNFKNSFIKKIRYSQ